MNNNQGFFFVSVFSLQSNKAKLQMDYKKKKAYMKVYTDLTSWYEELWKKRQFYFKICITVELEPYDSECFHSPTESPMLLS